MKIGPNPTRWCVDMVGFHDPLLAETEFRQHLPAALQIHILSRRLCIRRTTGRWCRDSVWDRSRAWKLTSFYASAGCPKTWTVRNRYGCRYAKICIFPTVSLSNGRRLTRLRDLRPWYGKRLYLGWRCSQASGVVAGRCSGEATRCRQTRSGDEDDRIPAFEMLC